MDEQGLVQQNQNVPGASSGDLMPTPPGTSSTAVSQQSGVQAETSSPPASSAPASAGSEGGLPSAGQDVGQGQQSAVPASSSGSGPGAGAAKSEGVKARELRKRSEKYRKEREIIKSREKETSMSKRFSSLIVPFAAVGVLALIIVFVFIPFSTEIAETRDNTQQLLNDIERNEKKIATLSSINLTELEEELIVSATVVRDTMDVSELAIEVERIAEKHNLETRSVSATNMSDLVVESSVVDTDWVPSYADVISGPFSYAGEFHDVTSFLEEIRNKSKTILSLGVISMMHRGEVGEEADEQEGGDVWTISLVISGYTAEPVQSVNVADPVRVDVNQDALDQMYDRAGKEIVEDAKKEAGSPSTDTEEEQNTEAEDTESN